MTKKEKAIQEALGLHDPLDFLEEPTISVVFKEGTPDVLVNKYNIPANDDYEVWVDPPELEYPIKDAEDFMRKVVAVCKARTIAHYLG